MQGREILERGGEFMGAIRIFVGITQAIFAVLTGVGVACRRICAEKTGKISSDIFSNAPRIAFCVDTG